MTTSVYNNDSAASILFNLIRDDGSAIVAQSALYALLDKDDAVLIAETAVPGFLSTNTTATIDIPASNNALPQGKTSDARKVVLKLTTATGEIVFLEKIYLIRSSTPIAFMKGSYQTLQEAELTALEVHNLTSFSSAPGKDKVAALAEAFNRLGMMTFSINYSSPGASIQYVTEFNTKTSGVDSLQYGKRRVIIENINLLDAAYIATLPTHFVSRLKVAQVIEADVILGGDSIFDKRKDGLMSETVGESSTMWRPGKPLNLPVSRRALGALTGYIHYGIKIGRG